MDERRFLNRELSWLDFDARVLELASEQGIPLLERAKFCAIFSSNLDEFFMVRVAALKDQLAAGIERTSVDGRTPSQQLGEISRRVAELVDHQERVLADELIPALRDHDIAIVSYDDLDEAERKVLDEHYEERVFPVLTPLAVDPSHPFPYISNLSLSIGAMVRDPETDERRFARIKIPDKLPRLIELDGGRFVPVEQLIASQLPGLFLGMEIEEWAMFRVTRNGDLTLEDEEADDLLELVEMELRRRRFNRAVRLEIDERVSEEMLALLVEELQLHHADVSRHDRMLDLTALIALHDLPRPDLKDEAWPPVTAGRLVIADELDRPIVSVMRDRAIMVHHPYESFSSSIEAFLKQAADDPKVQTIKMTLYRAGGDSQIIKSLMRASERGVQVTVLVELKARFDEANNVIWARQLERAGVHVIYGLTGLKTHCKCVMVVRDDGDEMRRYCHIGTGNYNSRTARLYEDIGILTCDDAIGDDVAMLFNHLTGFSRNERYTKLIVAPAHVRTSLRQLIERESSFGNDGRIVLKANSISDLDMAEALYDASAAGVSIELVVRGICCIRAGVPGLSDNITVRSILGRYLEHSRIFRFGHGAVGDEPLHLIGSADLMPRNLDGRVEVLVPVEHPKHQEWLDQVFDFLLDEGAVRWELRPDDTWERRGPAEFEPHPQELLYRWAAARQTAAKV